MKDEGKITDEKYQKAIATNPMRDEKGTYTGTYIEDGHEYSGEFKKGKFNGQGTYTFSNGDKIIGEFKDNNKNGYGKEAFPNGSKYIGEYKDNKPHGQGTMTHSDGKIEKGIWENGKLIKNEESN